jgi:hypothetical protein
MIISSVLAITLVSLPVHAEHKQGCNGSSILVGDSLDLICSATWQFDGKCLGEDMWNKWTVNGRTSPPDSFIRPFEDIPITVIGYELVKLQNGDTKSASELLNSRLSWFAIGSAIYPQPDIMIWLAPGETHSKQMWTSHTGQLWPSREKADSGLRDMLDLHGLCFGGGPVTIFVTIYYIPQSK